MVVSGDLINAIDLKEPTYTTNDEGGRTLGYTISISTKAKIKTINQVRTTEGGTTAVTGTKDFIIRWSADRDAINKDWIVGYKNEDYTIGEIELIEEKEKFIRIRAKHNG